MKRIVINKTKNGCAYAIRARYSGAGITQLTQGGGGISPQLVFWKYMKKRTGVIKYRRSEAERIRRHFHGDVGAKFQSREPYAYFGGTVPTITTLVEKDILLIEIYENKKEQV